MSAAPKPLPLVLPGAEDRTVIIGQTGSGKTVLAAWLLSKQNFEKRPWVWIDFKGEELLDRIGRQAMRPLKVRDMPGKRGLYRMQVNPWQTDALERWLERVWVRENIGLVVDEASLMPQQEAFKAVLRQGRSKHIPVIACTQRPVDCDREIFTEAQYRVLFGIEDVVRDLPVIRGLFGGHDVRRTLPPKNCYWWDAKRRALHILRPVPAPAILATDIRKVAPRRTFLG